MFRLFFAFLLFLMVHFELSSQSYPTNYFRSPLDIPLFLSGNFGELRSNHFHAGLDIKTQGVQGKKVLAAAEGYVSRIKVSPYGYGKALYITHPNGYTTVYGHLKKFSDKIEEYVKAKQYERESFSIQLFPAASKIPFKKGELVAYSGNSGGSGGPHLHFEVRDTKTEHPVNPLFFGFNIADQLNPDIYALVIYPLNDTSLINGSNKKKRLKAYGKNGKYRLLNSPSISLYGQFGFGIQSVDRMNGTGNTYGLHRIQLKQGEKLVFEQQIDEFAFHEGRYINALIDYEYYIRRKRRIQRSFVLPGNRLRIYKKKENEGRMMFNDGKVHDFNYVVSDVNKNQSQLTFSITAKKIPPVVQTAIKSGQEIRYFPFDQRNTFMAKDLLIDLPKGVLYEDLYFEYRVDSASEKVLSPIYWLHNHYTPLHSYISVSIKNKTLTRAQKEKTLIVSTTNGKNWYSEGGKWKGDNITVKTRSLGGYAIALDTIAPKIKPINIYEKANMRNKWSISVKIADNLSGINYYRGTIDGKWILMEYDAKKNALTYYFDERIEPGNHRFELIVKDKVQNSTRYSANFVR